MGSHRRDVRDMMARLDVRDLDLACTRRQNSRHRRQNQWCSPRDGLYCHYRHATADHGTWDSLEAIKEWQQEAKESAANKRSHGQIEINEAADRLREAGGYDKEQARGRRGRRIQWRHASKVAHSLLHLEEENTKHPEKEKKWSWWWKWERTNKLLGRAGFTPPNIFRYLRHHDPLRKLN